MLISDVMAQTQLSKKAIRYYEDRRLFETGRSGNGYKDYSSENVDRLIAIKKLRDLQFTIEEIRDYFDSDEKKSAVLARKLNETESKLSIHSMERDILESLNNGQTIGSINCDGIKIHEDKPYMYVRDVYKVLGVFNLISFLAVTIFFLFIREPAGNHKSGPMFAVWIIALSMIAIFEERRAKLKKQGINVLERKPAEIVLRYVFFLICYAMYGAIANECLFAMKRYLAEADYWGVGNSILVILMFLSFSVFTVIASFFDDINEFLNFFKRRRGSIF